MFNFLKKDKTKAGSWAQSLALAVLFFFVAQFLAGFLVARELQKRLDLKVHGKFWPVPFLPTFFGRDASFEWKNRITFLSGNLKVDYNMLPLLVNNSIRVRISGQNISARLMGEWAKMQGVENIFVNRFDADLVIAKKGLGEIYFVRAESPTFQFHIQKSET